MSVSSGRRHKQAVAIYNTVDYDSDVNPIGLKEDNSNALSANFGTERELLRGGCYRGDGVDSYVDILNTASLIQFIPETYLFTVSFWGRVTDLVTETANTFVGNEVTTSYNGFCIYHDNRSSLGYNNGIFVCIGYDGPEILLGFNNLIEDTEWHHYILSGDGTDINFYFDLVFRGNISSSDKSSETVQHNLRLLGGQIGSGGTIDTDYNGTNEIFDVRLFDRAVTEKERNLLYACKDIQDLLLKLNCSEHSGSICYDSHGNTYPGQIMNAITTTPEEDSNSIHQYQNIYSFENEEGFSYYNFDILQMVGGYGVSGEEGYAPYDVRRDMRLFIAHDSGYSGFSTLYYWKLNQTSYKFNLNKDQTGIYPFRAGYTYRFTLNIESIISGSFQMRIGNLATFSSPVIDSPGIKIFDIELPSLPGYAEYLQFGSTSCDAYMTLMSIEELDNQLYPFAKDASIALPPFKDILGNNLQYQGKVPGKAKFVQSNCWLGDGVSYLSITGLLTTDTIEVFGDSNVPICTIDGQLDLGSSESAYGISIYKSSVLWAFLSLCESIANPSSHIYYDVSGNGNHATLVNGTVANEGKQDEFHYSQKSCIIRSDGTMIPILEDGTAFADGSLLTDEDAILQDGKSFLNTGTKLQAYDYPALKQADKDNDFFYDTNGDVRQLEFGRFLTENPINSQYHFGKNSYSTDENVIGVTNIALYLDSLNTKQEITEKIVRDVYEIETNWMFKTGVLDTDGVWENKAYFDIKD